MRHLIFISIFAFWMSSCTYETPKKPNSSGKTLEVLVVCDKTNYDGALGDTLRAFLMRANPALNQAEPMFSLANIPQENFERTEMFQRMRNIILINFTTDETAEFSVKQDVYASNQIVFRFNVSSREKFYTLFREKRELMEKTFIAKERNRINAAFKTTENTKISEVLMRTFNFRLVAPEGFRILTKKPDFVSINKETKAYGQNVMIYTYPYADGCFEQSEILRIRNEIAKTYIFGPLDSSYMTTETLVKPIRSEVNLNGRYAVETRGLWKLVGDFMGGPFINYVFLDEEKNQMVMIDAFLYSPKKGKRDLLIQLESIVFSIDTKHSKNQKTNDTIAK